MRERAVGAPGMHTVRHQAIFFFERETKSGAVISVASAAIDVREQAWPAGERRVPAPLDAPSTCCLTLSRGLPATMEIAMRLEGKKVAILIAPRGTEDAEFAEPRAAAEKEGAKVAVVGLEAGKAKTVNNDFDPASGYAVDKTVP